MQRSFSTPRISSASEVRQRAGVFDNAIDPYERAFDRGCHCREAGPVAADLHGLEADHPAQLRLLLRTLRPPFHGQHRARSSEKRHPDADHAGSFREHRHRELRRSAVRRAVHRRDSLRFSGRQIRSARDLHLFTALVYGDQCRHGLPEHSLRAQPLALPVWHRHRGRTCRYRLLSLRVSAQAYSWPSFRLLPSHRFHGRTGRRLSLLSARAMGAVRHRWLALGRPDRRPWRRLHLVDPPGPAGEPALARPRRADSKKPTAS